MAVLGDEKQLGNNTDAGDNEKKMKVEIKKKELVAAYSTK